MVKIEKIWERVYDQDSKKAFVGRTEMVIY